MKYTNRPAFRPAALGILLSCCLGGAAHATALPAPVTLAECTVSGVLDDPSSCTLSGNDATAFGSLTLSPFISLTAQTSTGPINALGNPGAGVFVTAKYSFEILGGNPGDVVPILISAGLSTNASSFGHALGFAEVVVHSDFGDTSKVVCTDDSCGTTDTSFSGTFGWTTTSGALGNTIQLEIEASSGDSPFAEFASASADPFIFIDPSFAGAANYSVVVSPGVANAQSSVPEPGTLGLAAVALAILAVRFQHSATKQIATRIKEV